MLQEMDDPARKQMIPDEGKRKIAEAI